MTWSPPHCHNLKGMKINPKGGCHWERLKPTNMFSFNSGFSLGGMRRGWDALLWIHSLSYGIRGCSESCYEHTSVHWMTKWPFLGKGKKKILVSGTKTYKCISLLFLGYTKFIHEGRTLLSDKRKMKKSKGKKSENFSLEKQGTHFYLQKG